MNFDPSNIQQVGIAIVACIAALALAFLFFNGYRERTGRALLAAASFLFAWSLTVFCYYLFLPAHGEIARSAYIVSLIAQLGFIMAALRFAFVYRGSVLPTPKVERALLAISIGIGLAFIPFLVADLFGFNIVVGPLLVVSPAPLAPLPGALLPLLIVYGVYACIFTTAEFFMRFRTEELRTRIKALIVSVGLILALISLTGGFLVAYELPFATILRALAAPLFAAVALYTVSKYEDFKLEVAVAETFVFATWGFMFFRILLEKSLTAAEPDILLFVALLILGILLIRSMGTQVSIRLRLEAATKDLRVLNDSLEQKVAERTGELGLADEHLNSLIEHLPVGLVEVTDDNRIARINKSAEELFGVGPDIVGASIERVPQLRMALAGRLGAAFDAELTQPQKRNVQVLRAPLTLDGGRGTVAIVHDVTHEKMLERAKTEFVTTAAHQLRTPLTAIKWIFSALSESPLSDDQKKHVQQGALGASNMSGIVEKLLLAAHTSEGVVKYQYATVALPELMQQIGDQLTPFAERKKIHLTITLDALAPSIIADRQMLSFAIHNLIDNAIKYTKEGGEVTASMSHTDSSVIVQVKDTGIGIAPEDQRNVFSRFFRSDEARGMFTDGSGLGLSIVKSVVDAHGGTISFESAVGKGTTFTITLPVKRVSVVESSAKAAPASV